MQAELRAVILAWLAGLACPVINRPDAALWYRAGAPASPGARSSAAAACRCPRSLSPATRPEARAFRCRLAAGRRLGRHLRALAARAGYLLADDDALGASRQPAGAGAGLPDRAARRRHARLHRRQRGDLGLRATAGGGRPRTGGCRRFAATAHLAFVEVALAPIRGGLRRGDGRSRCRGSSTSPCLTAPASSTPSSRPCGGRGRSFPALAGCLVMILVCGGLADGVTGTSSVPGRRTVATPTACLTSPASPRTTGSPGDGRTAARKDGSPPRTGASTLDAISGVYVRFLGPEDRPLLPGLDPADAAALRGESDLSLMALLEDLHMPGGQPHRRRLLQ